MDTITDRESIPKLDEPELIQTAETRITKYAVPLIGVVSLALVALIPNTGLGSLPPFEELPEKVQAFAGLGLLLVLASIILGVAVIAAADIRARGEATAANFALRARPAIVIAPPGTSGTNAGLTVTRRGYSADEPWTVIDVQEAGTATRLLVARDQDVPTWIEWSEVIGWSLTR